MKVYFISGLAADSRVFRHIVLPEPFEIKHLDWVKPIAGETLSEYAIRMAESIDTNEEFVLAGLSMGGMMAAEIAKIHPPLSTILISSVAVHTDLPVLFKIAYHTRLHKIVPVNFLKTISLLKRDFMADNAADKVILKQVVKDSDPAFIRWAMNAILQWRNEEKPASCWHIHGSRDEILPLRYTNPTHIIPGGNHLMIMNKAPELNDILKEILSRYLPA